MAIEKNKYLTSEMADYIKDQLTWDQIYKVTPRGVINNLINRRWVISSDYHIRILYDVLELAINNCDVVLKSIRDRKKILKDYKHEVAHELYKTGFYHE